MKRWSVAFAAGALLLTMALFSCDAMFEGNLFSKLVQREISSSSVSGMTNDEVAALSKSDTSMQTMTDNPEAKQAVLAKLETTYSAPVTADNAAAVQVAALAAGTVIVNTVPVAKDFSGGLVETVISTMTGSDSTKEFNVESTIEKLLPADITAAVNAAEPTPPASFVTLVDTFMSASSAYEALNASLAGQTLETTTLTSEEVVSAGINAVLAYAITSVQVGADAPAGTDISTPEGVANLLWSQITATGTVDPVTGVETKPAIMAFDSFSSVPPELNNILALVGLDAVFGGSTTP